MTNIHNMQANNSILTLLIIELTWIYVNCSNFFIYKNTKIVSNLSSILTYDVPNKHMCASIAARYCSFGTYNIDGVSLGIGAFSVQSIGTKVICNLYESVDYSSQTIYINDTVLYLRNNNGTLSLFFKQECKIQY